MERSSGWVNVFIGSDFIPPCFKCFLCKLHLYILLRDTFDRFRVNITHDLLDGHFFTQFILSLALVDDSKDCVFIIDAQLFLLEWAGNLLHLDLHETLDLDSDDEQDDGEGDEVTLADEFEFADVFTNGGFNFEVYLSSVFLDIFGTFFIVKRNHRLRWVVSLAATVTPVAPVEHDEHEWWSYILYPLSISLMTLDATFMRIWLSSSFTFSVHRVLDDATPAAATSTAVELALFIMLLVFLFVEHYLSSSIVLSFFLSWSLYQQFILESTGWIIIYQRVLQYFHQIICIVNDVHSIFLIQLFSI